MRMSLDKTYIQQLRQEMVARDTERREIIKSAGDALHHAKRAIFSLHRDNAKEAGQKIKEAEKLLRTLQKKYGEEILSGEGSYRAGVEEYVEAALFLQFLKTGEVGRIEHTEVDSEVYIAGLCDLPGELYRYAIKAATAGQIDMVKQCARASDDIIGELIEFNLTSYLRTKFDQAKQANQKLERVVYEVSLRAA